MGMAWTGKEFLSSLHPGLDGLLWVSQDGWKLGQQEAPAAPVSETDGGTHAATHVIPAQ